MHPTASLGLLIMFSSLVLAVAAVLLRVVHTAAAAAGRDAGRDTRRAALVLGGWMAGTAVVALTGALADFSLPPKLPIGVFVGAGLTIWLAVSRFGTHLAAHVPLWVLVGVNVFRWPLEIVMNHAQAAGVMPVQMSYSGQNFDVLTGIGALIVASLSYKRPPPLRLIRLFNIMGFALLLNVLIIAVLSMPLPIRVYMNEPANTWIAYFPFVWLPAVLVLTALLSHILLLRRLVSEMSLRHRAT